ncbi:MAG: hypothetical protein LC104_13050 [Bacteroidales bacterium]|nr:hypothetical protein [Bacteroidales bacterium]
MSTFYILPPRECLEQTVASFLDRLVPGLPAPEGLCERILNFLSDQPDLFVVHREDLAGFTELADELAEGFGAEPQDRVVEVGMMHGSAPAAVRTWTMPDSVPDRRVA